MSLNTWLVKNLQYMLSTVEFFLVLFLLSWLLWWTDLLVLFFVRVPSCRLRSALTSALDSTKYVHWKAQPHCLPRPPSLKNIVPTSPCNARGIQYPAWACHRPQIDIPKHDGHVHTYVHSYIVRIDPSFKASRIPICGSIQCRN